MKLTFTKIVFALFSVLSVGMLNAQNINQMVVTNNGNSTQYDFVLASFGDNTLEVNAEATLVDDGTDPGSDACEPITSDLGGDIAVIDRGTCSFIDKVRNAQAAGAVAVVICNSQFDPTTGDDISDTAIIPGVAAGTVTDDVTVLVVGITYNDCQTLKLDLDSGATTIAFTFECAMPDYGPEVVWGANGEGAFNGGLNGWSVDNGDGTSLEDGGWYYDMNAELDRGAFGTNAGFAQTPTACNGVMLFDSDFYDTAGEADGAAGTGFNDGVCISDAAAGLFCEGLLISPDIDLAALNSTQGFEVSWTQSVRQFQSEYFLLLSKDGGATFEDTIAINSDIAVNTRVDDTRSVPLCGYNDVSQFRFAFLYRGAFYFWAIDDVIINEVPTTVDLSANPFFANYPNLVTPASQVDEAAFIIDVENLEAGTATNTSVDVEIFNLTTGTSVYTDSQDYPDIGCGVLDENRVFPDKFTGDLEEGNYEIRYTVNTDDDINPNNNTQSVQFEIGGDTFRKIDRDEVIAAGNDAYIAVPDEAFYSIGQFYRIPNGSGFKATSCRFGFQPETDDNGNPLEFNAIINFQLFRWRDDGDFACQPGERVLVGSSRRIVSSSQPEDFTNLFVELTNPNDVDAEIELADDGNYIMMASFSPLSSTAAPLRTLATPQADLPHYYGGTNLAFTQQFNEYRGGGFMLAVGIDGDEEDRTYGTGNNFTVYMPLTIKPLGATDTEDLVDDQSISVFPNPVSEMLYVDMNLDNKATDINLELVDVQGKVIATQNYNSTSGVLEMNVATVPAGIYSLNVRTEDGLTSKKVIIQ